MEKDDFLVIDVVVSGGDLEESEEMVLGEEPDPNPDLIFLGGEEGDFPRDKKCL
jgi:hypothetical protein